MGNVFFAGDAAHIHSPIGARGMNLGLEDAFVFDRIVCSHQMQRYEALQTHPSRRLRAIAVCAMGRIGSTMGRDPRC